MYSFGTAESTYMVLGDLRLCEVPVSVILHKYHALIAIGGYDHICDLRLLLGLVAHLGWL